MKHLEKHCPNALWVIDQVFRQGERTHAPMDWKELGVAGNMARASRHLALLAVDDVSEDHRAHAVARLMCALELAYVEHWSKK